MASEAFRKDVSRQLTELQDGSGPASIEFPASLSSEERKYIHNLCLQFKLKSKSRGSGANRYLTVSRKDGADQSSKGGGKAGKKGSSSAPPSKGLPFQLPPAFARSPCLQKLPDSPETWSLTEPAYLPAPSERSRNGFASRTPPTLSMKTLEATEAARRAGNSGYATFQTSRRNLPAWSKVGEILSALQRKRIVLVAGETGCGKSTQIPQFLLDASPKSRLVVTQPRRIAATSLAQRVSQERCEKVGGTVGYSIHMESKVSSQTRCTYCTTGVLRRRLLSDPLLNNLTHIVLDEVHERELNGDFILIILKQLMEERPHLRLVLMSATLEVEVFQKFFPGCATVNIPGRTFDVEHWYLDDVAALLHETPELRHCLGPAFAAAGFVKDEKDFKRQVATQESHPDQVCGYGQHLHKPLSPHRLQDGCCKHDVLQQGKGTTFDVPVIDGLIQQLHWESTQSDDADSGAILVFLPGWGDIDQTKRRLEESLDLSCFQILPCHSQIRSDQQQAIFRRPPAGVRKIILASNIAETSITIEDVTVVIDTGRAKETSYDPYLKVGTLATTFVSKASALQRAGRAGRVKAGRCFHLFSRTRHEIMEDFRLPELLRSPLEDVCLHTAHLLAQHRAVGLGLGTNDALSGGATIAAWLARAPQPPDAVAVKNAVELLKVLGALTSDGLISELGVKLAGLPLPVSIARSVIWGVLFGCIDPVLTIVSAASGRDPFQLPQSGKGGGKGGGNSFGQLSAKLRRLKQDLASPLESDHVASLRAVERYEQALRSGGEGAARTFCERYSVNSRTVQSIVDMREKMRQELRQQGLLTDENQIFANRNKQQIAVVLAVVTAGVFPNVAVRRAAAGGGEGSKRKIEAGGGRVAAASHPQSILVGGDSKGGKKSGGKGAEMSTEWLCYTEMTQVEERYSLTNISRATPASLLLLCGDDPLEFQGEGKDVSATLLDGWVEFILPRDHAIRLQNLRYMLRRAFITFCESPAGMDEFKESLDCAVAILKASMDASGKVIDFTKGYTPSVTAYIPAAAASSVEEYETAIQQELEAQEHNAGEWGDDLENEEVEDEANEDNYLQMEVSEDMVPDEDEQVANDVVQESLEDSTDLGTCQEEGEEMVEVGEGDEHDDFHIDVGGEPCNEDESAAEQATVFDQGHEDGDLDELLDAMGADENASAALRFMQGDIDFKDAALDLPTEPESASKRRRLG